MAVAPANASVARLQPAGASFVGLLSDSARLCAESGSGGTMLRGGAHNPALRER